LELLVIILPILIGGSIAIALFPEFALKGTGCVFAGCIGAGIGLGMTSSTAFWWLTAFDQPGANYIIFEIGLFIILASTAAIRIRHAGNSSRIHSSLQELQSPDDVRWLKHIFILLLIAFVAAFFLKAYFERPHGAHDAWAIWNYRARWLFKGGSHWANAFTYLNAADSPDYPLLVTGSVFRIWSLIGADHIIAPIVIAGILAVGSILVVFSGLTFLKGPNQGCLAAVFLLMTTQFMNVATYQYGDAPLAFFLLCTIVLFSLEDHFPDLSDRLLILAGLSTACAAWTKNEGVLFLLLIVVIRFLSRIHRGKALALTRQFSCFCLGLLPILITLVYFKFNFAIANDLVNQANLSKIGEYLFDIDRYIQVFFGLTKKILTFNDHIFILSIVYLALSGIDRVGVNKSGMRSHLWVILLMLLGYSLSFFISPHDLDWHMGSSLRRLLVQLWPTWVFLCFYCVKGPERKLSPLRSQSLQ
jgi:hypothetical protein